MAKKKQNPEQSSGEVIKLVWLEPNDAQLNPDNWRVHDELQLDSLEALIFDEGEGVGAVGWAGAALVNDRQVKDGWAEDEAVPTFVDGHARQKLAAERGEKMPALIGSWTPDQEALILATLDPLAMMAGKDRGMLEIVKFKAVTDNVALRNLMGKERAQREVSAGTVQEKRPDYIFNILRWNVPMSELEVDLLSAEADAYTEEFGMAHGFIRFIFEKRDKELAPEQVQAAGELPELPETGSEEEAE
jgi:hypothetical protein